jgi:neutral ceramidase
MTPPVPVRTSDWRAGRGIADVTGEAANCGMLGYGKSDQQTAGIHLRLRARAYVLANGSSRVLLVVCELPLMFDNVFRDVVGRLAERFGDLYTECNTLLTVTHTHCGPGGYSHARLYNSNTHGFRPKTYNAIVDGILEAVVRAHEDLSPTDLTLSFAELHDASVNRSRVAFDRNPAPDREFFPATAIDPQVSVLRLERDAELAGAITWFATHGTSMSNQNRLISSDNKGYASYHWERVVSGVDYLSPASDDVVTAFAQTNTGDMSPNLNHAPASGPTEDEFENTAIIGTRQYEAAAKALAEAVPLTGPVDSRMTWVKLSGLTVRPEFTPDGREHRTGSPSAGAAALAGTDEGRGFWPFRQGRNPVVDAISRHVIYRVNRRLRDAQAPKGLVLPSGLVNRVVPLVSERVPVQLHRIGSLYLIGIPGEVTITAGLRLRRTVAAIVGADLQHVLVAGYSNGYLHYVTTPEEYDVQRYEGGSTLFGRWELPALRQVVAGLAVAMRDGLPMPRGDVPAEVPEYRGSPRTLTDDVPSGTAPGDVVLPAQEHYRPGEQASVQFAAPHPSQDVRRGGTFLEIERQVGSGWERVADDGDWSTKFHWRRTRKLGSRVTITWDIPAGTEPGNYRIRYLADSVDGAGGLRQIEGTTESFLLVSST